MKAGIYISGLGQSVTNESAEKYAERLKNELKFNSLGVEYNLKKEKIKYTADRESTIYSICEEDGNIIYRLYEFKYHEILTDRFNRFSLIRKNLWLFLLVVRKFPLILKRLFFPASYNRPFQTLYVFLIFFIIAFSILILLPATLEVTTNFLGQEEVKNTLSKIKTTLHIPDIPFLSLSAFDSLSRFIVPFTALFILIIPGANTLLSNLATEFVCANDYMQYGAQRSIIQGNLEMLVDYISENESDCKIHLHAYSFGSILALDYIYPFGNKSSKNALQFCEAIITIGTPCEFVKSYYPKFYKNRQMALGENIHWLNVYSISDALATNFRRDAKIGEPHFGIQPKAPLPVNLNYEVSPDSNSIIDFVMLQSIKAHGMYWDEKAEGQSCLRLIYEEMNARKLIETKQTSSTIK